MVLLALASKELFAMFCRSMPSTGKPGEEYRVLGRYISQADEAVRGGGRYRGMLLSTLDLDSAMLVYCYKCRGMHDPFDAFADRVYVPAKSARCTDYDEGSSHMPPRATRKLLRAVTKHRLRGLDHRALLQQVNNTKTLCRAGHVVQVSLRMRYRGDDMLLRRQHVVASLDKTPQALFLFRLQLLHSSRGGDTCNSSLLKGIPGIHRPCNHVSWLQMYKHVIDDLILDPLCCYSQKRETSLPPVVHRDHNTSCFSREPLDLAGQPGNVVSQSLSQYSTSGSASSSSSPSPSSRGLPTTEPALLGGRVLGCDRCTTDMHLAIIPLPEPYGWGFALTTWIDIGTMDLSRKWDSHRPGAGPRRDYPRDNSGSSSSHEPIGSICARFEGLAGSPAAADNNKGGGVRFVPQVSELDLARLTNFGSMSYSVGGSSSNSSSNCSGTPSSAAAAAARGTLRTWSIEHAVDPATGRILDPDPLTADDY
ncbi:uncharacterized protein B0I36DRAFT_316494 [Microdochium trichocladiopsis]|uniref:Uncharacterized protein n=1 Tax=Microdochium trichocladiopsis TaxID=1682393 RepID=A0A9P9BQ63_9PEZI|nr:uncharacterized protein B0I36DRAFT_316494 [Microdochium trichocladiopsis]KAH7034543.1 hypothetical protein B0I36DRAFT_316494 [Microdochium trichocladiopsis]